MLVSDTIVLIFKSRTAKSFAFLLCPYAVVKCEVLELILHLYRDSKSKSNFPSLNEVSNIFR